MKYALGDLLIDTGRQSVSRSGVVIALPKLSYDLLLVLVRAAPNLVSLDDLMHQVWPGLVVNPETVSKRVMLLRDALGEDSRAPRYIAGLRGRGYQIIANVSAVANDPRRDSPAEMADSPKIESPPADADKASASIGSNSPPEIEAPPQTQRSSARLLKHALLTLLLAAGIGVIAYWKFHATSRPSTASLPVSGDRSIAVLPFTDMSEKKDQEYFADGMAEEILDVLTKVPGLKVISRTSSFQFKGKNEDVRKIGAVLGAAHIVEGSVRRSGERIRVTAQLIRSSDGAHEWSAAYDRDADDAMRVQQDIAISLSRTLQITVNAGSLSSTNVSPLAYDLYLRGLQAYERVDKEALAQAANFFSQALDLEPTYISAAESLALTHLLQADNAYVPAIEGWERVRKDARRLIENDSRSLMGHAILARIHTDYDWDWNSAKHEVDESLAINPKSVLTLYAAGALANALGKWSDAESHFRAALSVDPLDPDMHQILGTVLLGAGRFAEAAAEHRRALEIEPSFAFGHFELAMDLLLFKQPEEALREIELESLDGGKLAGHAMIYYALGRMADSNVALAQLTQAHANDKAYEIGVAHAFRGEHNEAAEWLERAYRQKDFELTFIKSDPIIMHDSHYKAILTKMNFPD